MSGIALLRMRQITKRFPGVVANDGVDFTASAGEVHALLGENGAGKSTLMSILAGLYQPEGGTVEIEGRPAVFRSPRDAIAARVGMVHQHFRLVSPFTVAENVTLGADSGFRWRAREAERRVGELADRFGLRVDPQARVWQLSVGEQQRVEILKLLYREARIVIMDEPTAVLTPQEARELFATLRAMAGAGKLVILIAHKLSEVLAVADRITVLRGGKVVGAALPAAGCSERDLARLMIGRDLGQTPREPGRPATAEPAPVAADGTGTSTAPRGTAPVLEVEGLCCLNDRGRPALCDLNLQVYRGEIVGVAGVAGNGQRELAEAVTGLRRATAGRVRLGGADVTNLPPRRIIDAGLAHVPEDRLGTGLAPGLDIVDNVSLKAFRGGECGRGPLLDRAAMRERARRLAHDFGVRAATLDMPVKLLSGGNLQKVLLAREISARPRALVAVHPTRGLDVGATEMVHRILREQRTAGTAVLLIAEDLDELFSLCDRIAVMHAGRVMGVVDPARADLDAVGMMMAGLGPEAVAS